MKYIFLGLISLLMSHAAFCQESRITKITTDQENSKVEIEYEIVGKNDRERYEVKIYSSLDNFEESLTLNSSSRDLGQGLSDNPNIKKPGIYTATWNYKKYLSASTNVIFELGLSLVLDPFILAVVGKKKRNKDIEVRWTGGKNQEKITLNLMKTNKQGDKEIDTKTFSVNSKNLFLNSGKTKGKGYYVEIFNESRENFDLSDEFRVKPSIPFIVKIIPFIAGAALAAYVYITYEPPLDPLPAPPEPN